MMELLLALYPIIEIAQTKALHIIYHKETSKNSICSTVPKK
jgi:hypothetical protein